MTLSDAKPERLLWVINRYYAGGKVDQVGAFFSEEKARLEASKWLSHDCYLSLLTIHVKDEP